MEVKSLTRISEGGSKESILEGEVAAATIQFSSVQLLSRIRLFVTP